MMYACPKAKKMQLLRSFHSSSKEVACISDVAKMLEKGEIDKNGVITWGGGYVKPRHQIDSLPLSSLLLTM